MVEYLGPRKTIPQCDKGSRISENGNGYHPQVRKELFTLERPEDNHSIPGTTFELPRPLIEFKVSSIAGGRAIGGGTSREALRRAKRDIKSQQSSVPKA